MTLVSGRRSAEATQVRLDLGLAARRLAVGLAVLGVAVTVGAFGARWSVWAWGLAAVMAIPAAFTLASMRHPFVAPCPACGGLVGDELVHLPDEPILGVATENHRCRDCGVYLDASGGVVREVPFHRRLDGPGFECTIESAQREALDWGDACVVCRAPATRGMTLAGFDVGVLSGHEAKLDAGADGRHVPYCDAHGAEADPVARGVLVARGRDRVTVQFSVYGSYRAFVDANRARVDVTVRSAEAAPPPSA